jgi:hypothetical protein
MEGQIWLVTFKQNHVKLTLAFMNIMNVIHHFRIFTNDLSKDNIKLHFWTNKPDVMYTLACVIEMKPHTCKRWPHLSMYQGTKSHQCEKRALVGGPKIIFCSWWSRNSKISLNKWPNKTKQLCSLRHIWWASLQMWYR